MSLIDEEILKLDLAVDATGAIQGMRKVDAAFSRSIRDIQTQTERLNKLNRSYFGNAIAGWQKWRKEAKTVADLPGKLTKQMQTNIDTIKKVENMPAAYQLALLDQALSDHDRVEELNEEMVNVYLTGDLAALQRLSDDQFSQLDPEIRDYFLQGGIAERNQHMAERLLVLLQEGRVFVAVGALHLPGPGGLLALLRQHGYDLEPMPVPFSP